MYNFLKRLCRRRRVAYADGRPWDMTVIWLWGEEVRGHVPKRIERCK